MNNIPKIIHYCWFGKKPKPAIVNKCIASWKYYMPYFQIIEWNEDNTDLMVNEYVKAACAEQKWAFVSDYVRFDVLYKYGGIYFDTDVELLKPIPEEILMAVAFTGLQTTKYISPGLVFGCCPQYEILREYLEDYEHDKFIYSKNIITVNLRITNIMKKYGFKLNGEYQVVSDLVIYPAEYFCGYNQDIHQIEITDKTISVHHYASSWMTNKQLKKRKFQKQLFKLIGSSNYKKIIEIKRKFLGVSKV